MTRKTAYQAIPPHVTESLTPAQKQSLTRCLSDYFKSDHRLDIRGTLPLPFLPKRIYFVLLGGIDRRQLTRGESAMQLTSIVLLIMCFFVLSLALGLIVLYILKSWLGIDLFESFSFGIW